MKKFSKAARWFGVICLFILYIIQPMGWNQWSIFALKGMFENPLLLPAVIQENKNPQWSGCRQEYWWPGLLVGLQGQLKEQQTAWIDFLECSQNSIPLLRFALPNDHDLAQTASRLYPDDPQVTFWLAQSFQKVKIDKAIYLLSRFAKSNPTQGAVACRLGTLYAAKQQYSLAVTAFLSCCENGNPNREGCLNAGLLMESLGDSQKAIEYYRLSAWDFDLKRADELERKLLP